MPDEHEPRPTLNLDGWFGLLLAFVLLALVALVMVAAWSVAGTVGGTLLLIAVATAWVMYERQRDRQ
jgi:preprotein translocase subunit SecY